MDLNHSIKLNPPSPIYELEVHGEVASREINSKRLLTISGNLYHKWIPVSWPFEESEEKQVNTVTDASPENELEEITADIQEDKMADVIFQSIQDIAAICQFTDQNLTPPRIQNTQINWVEEWTETTYRDLGIEEQESGKSEKQDILYEVLTPPNAKEDVNTLSNMKESKFLSWLKNKDARGKGFSEIKTEEKETENKLQNQQGKASDEPSSPGISKKKKKKELKKILKKSLEMEDEILSETLAHVMMQQGHTAKARKMYEKLSLIFPEKSGYFAQIIENLEEE